jgi:AcrR family transcriptional regulator
LELGASRPTIYRYFASTEALLLATSIDATGPFLDRLGKHVGEIEDVVDAIIESVSYAIERLPDEPIVYVLLASGRVGAFARAVTSEAAMVFGRAVFARYVTRLADQGMNEAEIDEFIEWNLRVVQSLLLDSGGSPRRGAELRSYLRRWLAPSLEHHLSHHAVPDQEETR